MFVYEEGTAIDLGSHGQTDYVFVEGTPVPNSGQSTLVFESGTGIGGTTIDPLAWSADEAGETVNITESSIAISIDGTGGAAFPQARRNEAVPDSSSVFVQWESVSWTNNSNENNFQFGLTTGSLSDSRLFEGNPFGGESIALGQLDPGATGGPGDFFRIHENGFKQAEVIFPKLDYGGSTMRIEWDGTTATLLQNGAEVASISHTFSGSPVFYGAIEVEDDLETDLGEDLVVGGYSEGTL